MQATLTSAEVQILCPISDHFWPLDLTPFEGKTVENNANRAPGRGSGIDYKRTILVLVPIQFYELT